MKRRTILMVAVPVLIAAVLLLDGIVEREHSLSKLTRVAKAEAVAAVQIIADRKSVV